MSDERAIDGLGRLARTQATELDPRAHALGRSRLVEAVAAKRGRKAGGHRRLAVGALAAAAALALAVVVLYKAWPARPLRYSVAGATEAEGGYVRAVEPATVAFSDGSRAELRRGTALRVLALEVEGAQLLVEGGHADFEVVHAPGRVARWSVVAGPFTVAVTGTRFSVDWDGSAQRLVVAVQEGAVVVRGPLVEDGVTVRAHQALRAVPAEGELHVETVGAGSAPGAQLGTARQPVAAGSAPDAPAAPPGPEPTSSALAAGEASAAPGAEPAGSAVALAARPPSWSQLVARGEFDAVLQQADELGFEAALGARPLDDVLALGDAARYRGQAGLAQRALVRVRERFPGSDAAASAAFLLGRMAEGGSAPAALGWYDRYLAEAPRGAFASEALGRKMAAVYRGSGKDAARALAEQYLRHYPQGAHAGVARQIVGP
ncbi:MAG: FecR domain-containing protein [Polyangiaceae bacterium]|nr:FecR domain-containing protein [Polyangiaceae bacterium]